jgi:phospholipase A1
VKALVQGTTGRRLAARRVTIAALLCLCAWQAVAQTAQECAATEDDAKRLACYDRLFRDSRPPEDTPRGPEEGPRAGNAGRDGGADGKGGGAAPGTRQGVAGAPAQPGTTVSSLMSTLWELGPDDKRGTFIVRTYLPNFVLPLHVTSRLNREPESPTRDRVRAEGYRRLEAKLQISLRAKVVEGLILPDADLWFAYTQRSLWQVWTPEESAPFRSTDYQPEIIYMIPVPRPSGELAGGWRLQFAQLGVAHQSNGQSEPLSRSWNRVYAGAGLERGQFGLQLRANRRIPESGDDDDNPDLTRYIGSTEVQATWLPGRSTASLTWRTNLRSWQRGSLQLDWTYPVDSGHPDGLRWYAQVFSGFGETLLDYNVRQTSVGLGVTLFQF